MPDDSLTAPTVSTIRPLVQAGHALDLIECLIEAPDLIATDPPYAFGGTGDEHAISATVATVLRESARRLKKGRWMLVMCAASWRSTAYMVEAVRAWFYLWKWSMPIPLLHRRTIGPVNKARQDYLDVHREYWPKAVERTPDGE